MVFAIAGAESSLVKPATAQGQSAALIGLVTSQEGGVPQPLEGVLVSAKRDTIAVTVVTDGRGRYTFPRSRLNPGAYSLRVRAIGYEIDGSRTVDVTAQHTAQGDLTLRKTQDLASQLSNGEWFMSW